MAIIKKNNFIRQVPLIPDKQGIIKYWVDARADEIEIKVYSNEPVGENETADVVVLWDIIKLSELQKKSGFVDQTLWTRVSSSLLALEADPDTPYVYHPTVVNEGNIIDMFGETVVAKPYTLTNLSSKYTNYLYSIFVPDASDFSSCVIRLTIDVNYEPGFEVVGPSANLFVDEHVLYTDLVSPITLSSNQTTVAPDSSITVNVQTDTFIDEVYLEQVYGILNKSRVKLTNGSGSFVIYANGLQAGETVKVKAGHKKFTGISNFSVPVV